MAPVASVPTLTPPHLNSTPPGGLAPVVTSFTSKSCAAPAAVPAGLTICSSVVSATASTRSGSARMNA